MDSSGTTFVHTTTNLLLDWSRRLYLTPDSAVEEHKWRRRREASAAFERRRWTRCDLAAWLTEPLVATASGWWQSAPLAMPFEPRFLRKTLEYMFNGRRAYLNWKTTVLNTEEILLLLPTFDNQLKRLASLWDPCRSLPCRSLWCILSHCLDWSPLWSFLLSYYCYGWSIQ